MGFGVVWLDGDVVVVDVFVVVLDAVVVDVIFVDVHDCDSA